MRTTDPGDAARIELLLAELRLPAIKLVWASLAAQADKEGWPAGRFLAALAEHEIAERSRRRLERHLAEARLPPGKTLDSFDFEAVPVVSKAQVMALAAGDAWVNNGANLLLFGPPGGGKSHLAAALGFALVENGWRVLFTRTADLVQRLQIARRELALEAASAMNRRWLPHLVQANGFRACRASEARPAPRLSIAVLPFANLSNDPDQEYFADGITDDLTTALSRLRNVMAFAEGTVCYFRIVRNRTAKDLRSWTEAPSGRLPSP